MCTINMCCHSNIDHVGPPHLGTPNRPQHYAVSMVHPSQAGSSRQFSHPSPVQVGDMMSSIVSHDLLVICAAIIICCS